MVNVVPTLPTLFPLQSIYNEMGNVLHALKSTDACFTKFGEAYFSCIHPNKIKGWKRHTRAVTNLIVPHGEVRIVILLNSDNHNFFETVLSPEEYNRLFIPPGFWFSLQALSHHTSILLNISDLPHDRSEVESVPLDFFSYSWF